MNQPEWGWWWWYCVILLCEVSLWVSVWVGQPTQQQTVSHSHEKNKACVTLKCFFPYNISTVLMHIIAWWQDVATVLPPAQLWWLRYILLRASGCLFSFLSFYFLPFFPRHLKLQRLKGMADGWSNRHSAAQWTPAASGAAARWERRAGLWMKHWACVLWRARRGGEGVRTWNLHMNIKKGWGLAKNRPDGQNKILHSRILLLIPTVNTLFYKLNSDCMCCMIDRKKATTYYS